MENEIWEAVKGYEGYYEVSNFGRVKSVERIVKWGDSTRFVHERIKETVVDKSGYLRVTLCKDRKSKQFLLHRVIAEAFIPNPENKPQIDHINTIRTDNRIENLRWATNKENSNNPITFEKCHINNYTKEVCRRANETKRIRNTKTAPKYVYQFDKNGKFLERYSSSHEAQEVTGIHNTSIREVCAGKRYSAGGYYWSYEKENFLVPRKKRNARAKRVLQYTKEGEFLREWECLSDVCEVYGSAPSNLSRSIRLGKFKGKYIWKFKE